MRLLPFLVASCFAVVALTAQDAGWKTKQIAAWSEQDARDLLASSPWCAAVSAARLPDLTPEQRRAGGATGGGTGSGLGNLEGSMLGGIRETTQRKPAAATAETVLVRWESALPVRAAELKSREVAAPDWEGDYYAISVRDVPELGVDLHRTARDLSRMASLKRAGMRDSRPARVEIFPQASGKYTVLYLFPHSTGITAAEESVQFAAQMGRLFVSHRFSPFQMFFQQKLEL